MWLILEGLLRLCQHIRARIYPICLYAGDALEQVPQQDTCAACNVQHPRWTPQFLWHTLQRGEVDHGYCYCQCLLSISTPAPVVVTRPPAAIILAHLVLSPRRGTSSAYCKEL